MPKPGKGEIQEDFIKRCIPIVIDEGTAKDEKQAYAICLSMFEGKTKESRATFANVAPGKSKYNLSEALLLSESEIVKGEGDAKTYMAWWPLLKEGPGNKVSKNYYSKKSLETLAPKALLRNKIYFGHMKEGAVGDRDPREWAASIRETKIEDGVLFGKVQALDPWLKERMYDAPQDLALSIEGRGKKGELIDVDGEKWNVIESVAWLNGFCVVDYPGNAPMGISIAEGDPGDGDPEKEVSVKDAKELQEKFPEIYKLVIEEGKSAVQVEIEARNKEIKTLKESLVAEQAKSKNLDESVVKLEAKVDAIDVLTKKKDRDAAVREALSKLPAEALTEKFKELVEKAPSQEVAMTLIEERKSLFDGKVFGHGKTTLSEDEKKARKDAASRLFESALGIPEEKPKK